MIRYTSDSKITDETVVRNNPLLGSLKLFILTPQICFGFSGKVYFAEKFLEEFYSKSFKNFGEILQRCWLLNKESSNDTFFTLGTLFNNDAKIYKIYDGKIDGNSKDLWIGDKDGFNKFQETFLSNTKGDDDFSKMESAFAEVISDEKIPSVSDFQISVETDFLDEIKSLAFIYKFKTSMSFAPQNIVLQPKPGENKVTFQIPFGGAEIGGFGISYLRSTMYIRPAIAMHFPQGEFGVLFCPEINLNKAIIFNNQPDGEDFVNEVMKKYGISLQGMVAKNGNSFKNVSG